MRAVSNLDREVACPSCGAGVTFKFAGALSLICEFCQAVVARTDRGFEMQGRMAAVLDIASPLSVGTTGNWNGETFEVTGRVQMDRAGAPGAPWQEFIVWLQDSDRTTWVAYAQGKWYATNETESPVQLPQADQLQPGGHVSLGQYGNYVVQEVGQRRTVAGEGSIDAVPKPGVIVRYADISGADGAFGTIDWGDGTEAPTLYLGRVFSPDSMTLDSGYPLEVPQDGVAELDCPNCGGTLPMLSEQTERVVCQYCGTASDKTQGKLAMLGPAPKPPIMPYIPIGSTGNLRGVDYTVCGFVIRSCMVEGIVYNWREYLLYGGMTAGYRWLMEEDGKWSFVEPLEAGEVTDSGNSAMFRGGMYTFAQQVQAKVDYVIGEFYWKVEVGESVDSTEYKGPGGKVSRERSPTEVNYSFCSDADPQEIAAFGVPAPGGGGFGGASGGGFGSGFDGDGDDDESNVLGIIIAIVIIICVCIFMALGDGCGGGGYSGGGYGGPSYGK
jgi:DNA-directed RNA polymerase subunit RPC12/RpoP